MGETVTRRQEGKPSVGFLDAGSCDSAHPRHAKPRPLSALRRRLPTSTAGLSAGAAVPDRVAAPTRRTWLGPRNRHGLEAGDEARIRDAQLGKRRK
jgi:hypothetical protein